MTINLTCTQVSALLSYYLEDKLNAQLKQFVKAHLDICPTCSAKYEALKSMVKSLKEIHKKITDVKDEERGMSLEQYENFKMNLSAYVDNELTDDENIKIKKYVISNTRAREDLEKLYGLKRILHASFEKTKNDVKIDFAKDVLRKIDIQDEMNTPDAFIKVVAIFIILFAVFTISAVLIFWV